jgi:hypothetical protein
MANQIIFNVASYKRHEFLLKTIDSIYMQADVINIALNGYKSLPDDLIDRKINLYLTDNSIGDGFKFLCLMESEGYYFTIDDDLIYPPEYAWLMIDRYISLGSKSIVTLHGRRFNSFPIESYYRTKSNVYQCLKNVDADQIVHSGGTGVMMFHTDLLSFPINEIKAPNMADVWLAKIARERNIPITVLKHPQGFLKYQNVGNDTIFSKKYNNDQVPTQVINSVFLN